MLQQFFNKHLLKVEQEEYIREKIDWKQVDFEDNQLVVELIEKVIMETVINRQGNIHD